MPTRYVWTSKLIHNFFIFRIRLQLGIRPSPFIISGSGPQDQIREKYTMHFRSTEASHRCSGSTIHHSMSANPNLNHCVSGWGCIFPFFAFSTSTHTWAGLSVFNGSRYFLSRVLRLPVESAADKHNKHPLFAQGSSARRHNLLNAC